MKEKLVIEYESLNLKDFSEIEHNLFNEAKIAREKAYAPYSNFLVGCAVLLENGEIHRGSNQENAAYPSGLCAERSIIYWLGANLPEEKIKKIFVVGGTKENPNMHRLTPPCGSCRQGIIEYEVKQGEDIEIYISSLNGGRVCKLKSIKDLLPFNFDSSYL